MSQIDRLTLVSMSLLSLFTVTCGGWYVITNPPQKKKKPKTEKLVFEMEVYDIIIVEP